MRYLPLFLFMIVMVSCETLVDNIPDRKLPKIASKLVVHSFISPQNARINVTVSESSPIFSNTDIKGNVIKTALVKISDGVNEATLPFDTASQLYSIDQSKFPVAASKTYSLYVLDGTRKVTASCTVPAKTPTIHSYKLDTVKGNPLIQQDTILTLKMAWQDIPNEPNYYRARASAEIEYDVPGPDSKRIRNEFNFSWDEATGHSEWQSDRNREGSLFSSPNGKVFMPNFALPQTPKGLPKAFHPNCRLIAVTMMVYNADVNYFKYHRSLQQRLDTENPFTEPSIIYTNIEGGLGCFGAYNIGKLVYTPD